MEEKLNVEVEGTDLSYEIETAGYTDNTFYCTIKLELELSTTELINLLKTYEKVASIKDKQFGLNSNKYYYDKYKLKLEFLGFEEGNE